MKGIVFKSYNSMQKTNLPGNFGGNKNRFYFWIMKETIKRCNIMYCTFLNS